jgi:hypothetical protein
MSWLFGLMAMSPMSKKSWPLRELVAVEQDFSGASACPRGAK